MAKQGITPVNNADSMLRILILSMFFSVEVTYVIGELRKRRELQLFLRVEVIPEADDVYRFFSRTDEDHFIAMINGLIRNLSRPSRKRKEKTIIIDGSAITLDIKLFKKRLTKKELEKND
ncbi:hypothetical protein [Methanogenium organophilum]|uniref:Uncharacterized protein n=1 Tax=Methanogenium organophilum TaxID=2199 RepID=A0A9X9S7F3_METOG|nr:hypothetical protein [Methanogenium organophilum]WAI02225.1 hypothetical protein OU421_04965 [Methanogenium organophilum]